MSNGLSDQSRNVRKFPLLFLHLQRASIINIIVAFLVADLPFTVGVLTSTTGIAQCSDSTHFLYCSYGSGLHILLLSLSWLVFHTAHIESGGLQVNYDMPFEVNNKNISILRMMNLEFGFPYCLLHIAYLRIVEYFVQLLYRCESVFIPF